MKQWLEQSYVYLFVDASLRFRVVVLATFAHSLLVRNGPNRSMEWLIKNVKFVLRRAYANAKAQRLLETKNVNTTPNL